MCIPRAGGAGVPGRARAGHRPAAGHRPGLDGHRRLRHVLSRRRLGATRRAPDRTRRHGGRAPHGRPPGVEPASAPPSASATPAALERSVARQLARGGAVRPRTSRSTAGSSRTGTARACRCRERATCWRSRVGASRRRRSSSPRPRGACCPRSVRRSMPCARARSPVNLLPAEERRGHDEGISLATIILVALSALLAAGLGRQRPRQGCAAAAPAPGAAREHRAPGARGEEAAGGRRPAPEGDRHAQRGPGAAGHARS